MDDVLILLPLTRYRFTSESDQTYYLYQQIYESKLILALGLLTG